VTYDGPRVFRAPFASAEGKENFERTVLSGLPATEVAEHTDRELISDTVRLWGTKETVESTWSKVSTGDFLLFYRDSAYQYAAEVLRTEKNTALGKAVWPNYEDGSPWSCIIYLKKPVRLNVSSEEVHGLAGYDIDYPMGFSPLNEMGIGGLRGRYGSIESFVYGEQDAGIDTTATPTIDVPAETLDGLHFPDEGATSSEAIVGKVTDALNAGKHLVLTGPPGTGKTEIARRVGEHIADEHPEVFTGVKTTTATADWSTFETVGGYMPEEGASENLAFQPGQVLRCFKRKGSQQNDLLIIDEINRSDIDKSFGQLFTLLSGQRVRLPFTDGDEEIEVRPAESEGRPGSAEYVVPSSWRLFATMNSYDKTSLYEMSYAFMRRFAFVYIDAPDVPSTAGERERFVAAYADCWGIDAAPSLYRSVGRIWYELNNGDRKIGPAIVKDVLRHANGSSQSPTDALTEAVLSYVFPQLEGLRRRERVVDRLAGVDALDGTRLKSVGSDLLGTSHDG